MAIISVSPKFAFISTGELTRMYTYRYVAEVIALRDGQRVVYNDDFYVQNLSTDLETARSKATQMAQEMGIPFRDNATVELEEIRRRAAGEAQAEKEAREAARKAWELQQIAEWEGEAALGFMACGKHLGKTAEEIIQAGDEEYVDYCASEYAPQVRSGAWQINCKVCFEYRQQNPIQPSEYVGQEGDKVTLDLTLITRKVIDGRFWTRLFVGKTQEGNIVKFFSTAKAFENLQKGDQYTITGTVKEHSLDHYMINSPKTTLINRPKMA